MKGHWYLSFADDSGFLGACIVKCESESIVDAVRVAHRLGINPGGQVLGIPLVDDDPVPADAINRLLKTKEEIAHVFGEQVVRIGDLPENERPKAACEMCHAEHPHD